jgi:hypothetical protein
MQRPTEDINRPVAPVTSLGEQLYRSAPGIPVLVASLAVLVDGARP